MDNMPADPDVVVTKSRKRKISTAVLVPAGILNHTNFMCFVNSAIQLLGHNPVYCKVLGCQVNSPEQAKLVAYLKAVFKLLGAYPGSVVNLKKHRLAYKDHLNWFSDGEDGSAGDALGQLMEKSLSEDDISAFKWFGGQIATLSKITAGGDPRRKPVHHPQLVATVGVLADGELQNLFDSSYSRDTADVVDGVWIGDGVGQVTIYEKIAECPLILSVQVGRVRAKGKENTAFYSSLTYSMELDVSKAVEEPDSMERCDYRLVSMLVRQTTWRKAGSRGHYMAVCSSKGPADKTVAWHLFNDGEVSVLSEEDVLRFSGEEGSLTWGTNKKNRKENRLFVEYFQFVRADYLDAYYAGTV